MPSQFDRFLDRALKVRPGEKSRVGLMALYAANAIGAVVVGRTVRDTLFLTSGTYTKDDLPVMYILNSIAVALLSWGYSRFADRARRDRLNSGVAAGWAVVMLGFFFVARQSTSAVAPALYVAVEAMGALVVIQFWTFAQDVFTSREAKRLFGLIGAGGQVANVVYGFLAATVSSTLGAESLLVLCALNLAGCGFLAWYIGRRFGSATGNTTVRAPVTRTATRLKPVAPAGARREKKPFTFGALATPHLLTIAAIAMVSAVAVNLVDFQFKAAAEMNFQDKGELGAFFGRFYAICGAVALAIQMGVTGRVLERFGVLASLLPLPVGLLFGSFAAHLSPGAWAASLAKGSDSIFRYTINDASMQLLYLPVQTHLRGRAKALIDGILRPVAGVIAGLLLVVLGKAAALGPGLSHGDKDPIITTIVVLLVVGWIFLLVRARRHYVASLLETLQRRRLDLHAQPMNADQATADALAKVLDGNDALAILHALQMLQHVRGRDYAPKVAKLLDHPVSSVRAAATNFLARSADRRWAPKIQQRLADEDPWCVAAALGAVCALEKEKALPMVQPFLRDRRPAMRAAAVVGLVRHAGISGIIEAAEELKRQLGADSAVERELAASVLGEIGVSTFYNSLLPFLEDPSAQVRRAALRAAGRLKSPELVEPVLEQLASHTTAREATLALVAFGPGVVVALGRAMNDTSLRVEVRRAVPAVLARLGSREAAETLSSGLETNDPPLRAAIARALAKLMRRRSDVVLRRDVIRRAIHSELTRAENLLEAQRGLNLPTVERTAALRQSRGTGARPLLALALIEERDRIIARTLELLVLLHPKGGLDLVAENLRSDLPSRRANAVEVIDNTVKDEVKKRLLPLIEERTALESEAARSPTEWAAALLESSSPWIAACAARYASEHQLTAVAPQLMTALEHQVAYVREAAASALVQLAPQRANEFIEQLARDPARSVRQVAEGARVLARLATA